jgi:hypothetical protein
LALVHDDAPTRTILCAGAGHFSRANITMTLGAQIGSGDQAGEQVIARWDEISDRTGEITPDYGFMQMERELQSSGLTTKKAASAQSKPDPISIPAN